MLAQISRISVAYDLPVYVQRDPIVKHLFGAMADRIVEELAPKLVEPLSLLAKVKDSCKLMNPWDCFDNYRQDIFADEASATILEYLLREAETQRRGMNASKNGLLMAASVQRQVERMAGVVAKEAMAKLEVYSKWERETSLWKRYHNGEKPVLPPGHWPSNIYSAFGAPLRYATGLKIEAAQRAYKALVLESTLPLEEMERPAHADAYTGISEERDEPVTIRQTFKDWDAEMEFLQDEELHWDADDYQAHLAAQTGGYNADMDDTSTFEKDMSELVEPDDQKDFGFKMDLSITDEAKELKRMLRDEIEDLRRRVIAAYEAVVTTGEAMDLDPQDAIRLTQKRVLASTESQRLLRMLREQARYNLPQDIASVLLEFANDYCWGDEQLRTIHCGSTNIARWMELTGEDFLEQFQDAAPTWEEPSQAEIEEYSDAGIFQQVYTYTDPVIRAAYNEAVVLGKNGEVANQKEAMAAFWKKAAATPPAAHRVSGGIQARNAFLRENGIETAAPKRLNGTGKRLSHNHPCFIAGMLKAALAGSTDPDAQIAAGWESFRSMLCPEGNEAYHIAIGRKASQKEAMTAFWALFNKKFPRKEAVVGLSSSGLTLEGGRKVSWHVAAMKFKGGELDLDDEKIARLKQAMTVNGWTNELSAALA